MNRIKLLKPLLIFSLLFFSLFQYSSADAVPGIINYQGTLTDIAGNPVPDGQYGVVFSIYNVVTGGSPLWTETWNSSTAPITTIGGNFSILLGSHNPIPNSIFNDNPVTYLGIKVGTDSEMVPRQKIASVGYAFKAEYGVPKGAIIMWSGAIAQIPEGWALCDGQNGTPDLRDRFIVGAGSGYAVGVSGGSNSISLSHSHTVNNHSHAITSDGGHNHTYSGTTGTEDRTADPDNNNDGRDETVADNGHRHNFSGTTSSAGSHSHGGITGSSAPETSSALPASQDIRPPYYALAFIMKL